MKTIVFKTLDEFMDQEYEVFAALNEIVPSRRGVDLIYKKIRTAVISLPLNVMERCNIIALGLNLDTGENITMPEFVYESTPMTPALFLLWEERMEPCFQLWMGFKHELSEAFEHDRQELRKMIDQMVDEINRQKVEVEVE